MPSSLPETPKALYGHCVEVYEAMLKTAEPVDDENFPPGTMRYRGFLTHTIRDLHLSSPHFTKVRRALMAMDCIRQERRGGGGAPSIWILLQPPSPDLWSLQVVDTIAEDKGRPSESATDQRVRDLHNLVQKLSSRVDLLEARFEEGNL